MPFGGWLGVGSFQPITLNLPKLDNALRWVGTNPSPTNPSSPNLHNDPVRNAKAKRSGFYTPCAKGMISSGSQTTWGAPAKACPAPHVANAKSTPAESAHFMS